METKNMLALIVLINDALTTLKIFQPVIATAMLENRDVTDEELHAAAAKCGMSIQQLDALIAASP